MASAIKRSLSNILIDHKETLWDNACTTTSSAIEPYMPKSNPFYHYLKKNHSSLVQKKTDTHEQPFLLIELDAPSVYLDFEYNGTKLVFIEHHVTIYNTIEEDVGFKSHYHYTIRFETHTMHVYFNRNGEHISATIQSSDSQVINVLRHFFDDTNQELLSVKIQLEQKVAPMMQQLRIKHRSCIQELESRYSDALTHLKDQLFDESEQPTKNLKLNKIITLGNELLSISDKTQFVRSTLSYLNSCQRLLTEPHENIPYKKETSTRAAFDEASTPSTSAMTISGARLKPSKQRPLSKAAKKTSTTQKSHIEAYDTEKSNFITAYEAYLSQWSTFESCETLSDKLNLFGVIGHHFLTSLSASALILLSSSTNPASAHDYSMRRKAELDVNLFQKTYEKTGISLLLECFALAQSPTQTLDIDIYEETLKKFAPLLSSADVINSIRRQNVPALSFLLKHGSINLNHYVIPLKGGRYLSPLCAAYHYKNIELFELLLKNNASCMTLYEDMPLAYTLLELHAGNQFKELFLREYKPVLDANPRFYTALCVAINGKLRDTELTESQRERLQNTHTIYQQKSRANHGETVCLPQSVRDNISSIREVMNQGALQMIDEQSHEEEISGLYDELNKQSSILLGLKRKTHQSHRMYQECADHFKKAKQLIDCGFQSLYGSISKDDIIFQLKSQLRYVNASIDYLTLYNLNSKSKNELKRLATAMAILQENTKQQQRVETQIEIQNLSKKMMNLASQLLDPTCDMSRINIDELEALQSGGFSLLDSVRSGKKTMTGSIDRLTTLMNKVTQSTSNALGVGANALFMDGCDDQKQPREDSDFEKVDVYTAMKPDTLEQKEAATGSEIQDPWETIPNPLMEDEAFYARHPMVDSNPVNYSAGIEAVTLAIVPYDPTFFTAEPKETGSSGFSVESQNRVQSILK